MKTYLALGDSMSIDDYTGVVGGGAAKQFFQWLGEGWSLDDRTYDGCQMRGVPRDAQGDLVTLTIGGNDLLWNRDRYLREGIDEFASEHRDLLVAIRQANPNALFIVGDVYAPAAPLSDQEQLALEAANAAIHANARDVNARVARIYDAFRGNEATHLCLQIEPTLTGATTIARLFREAYQQVNSE